MVGEGLREGRCTALENYGLTPITLARFIAIHMIGILASLLIALYLCNKTKPLDSGCGDA